MESSDRAYTDLCEWAENTAPPYDEISDYPRVAWSSLARTAGRYPGSRFGDDLARLATGGAMDAAGLLQHARGGDMGQAAEFDPRGLAWFAHLRASQSESADRADDTAHLFRLAYRVGGRRALAKQLDTVWVQALHLAGRLDEFATPLKNSAAAEAAWWAAEADAIHPGALSSDSRDWLGTFNRPLRSAGLEPVTFLDGPGSAFDRLTSAAALMLDEDLPLVSVVMPVYNPGPSLGAAVRSLLAQSWPNLEILICDDASTHGIEMVDELARQDSRVRVLQSPRNGGAYAARNHGIGAAKGEFVTFNDADDWAHPQRIERQVSAVLADDKVLGSLSWSIRLSAEMRLTVMGRIPKRINLSSIMFHRAEVLHHLGGFDAIRKGADSEFVGRFTAVFGTESLVELVEPLSMVQLTAGSLSRDDYRFLRTHPARLQYMADLRHWHTLVTRDPSIGYLPPGCRAPFPASTYLRGQGTVAEHVDVLMLANLGDEAPTIIDLAAEVRALSDLGLRVGLLEYLGPHDLTQNVRLPTNRMAELVRRERAIRILPWAPVTTRLAVVRDPAAVHAMPLAVLDHVSAPRALVIADYVPLDGRRYSPAAVASTLCSHAGSEVTWLPATPQIYAELSDELAAGHIKSPALFGTLAHVARRGVTPGSRLRAGISLEGEDGLSQSTMTTALDALLPTQTDVDVVMWGLGRNAVLQARRPLLHLDSREVSLTDFVDQVDVLIAGSAPGRGGHLNRVAATAAARGCILLLSPEYRGHFGEAALYLDDQSVSDWLVQLSGSADFLAQQRARASEFACRQLAPKATAAHVIRALQALEETDQR